MFTSNVVSMLNERNKMTQVSYLTKTGPMNSISPGQAASPASTYVKDTASALCYLCSLCTYVSRGKRHKGEQPLNARGTRRPH